MQRGGIAVPANRGGRPAGGAAPLLMCNKKWSLYTNETYPIALTPVGQRRQPTLPGFGYFCSSSLYTGTSLSLWERPVILTMWQRRHILSAIALAAISSPKAFAHSPMPTFVVIIVERCS